MGCSSLTKLLFPKNLDRDAKISWKHDLKMQINGVTYYGMALVPKADSYEVKVFPPTKEIDRLMWNTCHRGNHADKAVQNRFWPWQKDDEYFVLNFTLSEVETKKSCSLRFAAFEQKHKNIAFGYVSFPDKREEAILPATTHCSGVVEKTFGKNICQAPVNALQKIEFSEPVLATVLDDGKCEPPKGESEPGQVFTLFPSKDECVYIFQSNQRHPNGKRLIFVWEVYGWEEIPPPEED